MRQKLLIANWKMNPATERAAVRLAHAEDLKNVVIAAPFSFLGKVGKVLRYATLGAQDVFWENTGPYTGEEGPMLLKNIGVRYVIVGHSERRRLLKETDRMVAQKTKKVLSEKMIPICCVGEPLVICRKGKKIAWQFVKQQVEEILRALSSAEGLDRAHIIVAYEPPWAITTSKTGLVATPHDAAEMILKIKTLAKKKLKHVHVQGFYGGSVDQKNIGAFLHEPAIDGALVGGASLRPGEFWRMAKIAETVTVRE